MTPERAIAMLDRQVASHGQEVTLRRYVANGSPIEASVRAFVRGYKPEELVAGIQQGSSLVAISPTVLADTPFAAAKLRPLDKVDIDGRERNIGVVEPVSIGAKVVRFNVTVLG